MTIEIDKNVPLPTSRNARKLYPIEEMLVGDSFFAAGKYPNNLHGVLVPYRARGWRFVSRTVRENGIEGVRLWRTA